MRFRPFRAACVAALCLSAPTLAQTPAPPAVDLDTVEPIVGNWSYHAIPGGSEAVFLDTSASVRALVRCGRANRAVTFTRTVVPAAVPAMVVTTSFGARSLPASFDSARNLSASVAAADPFLDDVAFSRGKIALGNVGSSPLVLPAWPEVDRVIEDCRN